jgi:hypothetical protein
VDNEHNTRGLPNCHEFFHQVCKHICFESGHDLCMYSHMLTISHYETEALVEQNVTLLYCRLDFLFFWRHVILAVVHTKSRGIEHDAHIYSIVVLKNCCLIRLQENN